MTLPSPLQALACVAFITQFAAPAASAEGLSTSLRARIQSEAAIRLDDGSASLARIAVEPRLLIRSEKNWRADISGRLIVAADETGLGTISTFAGLSQPIELGQGGRLELDRAFLTFSAGEHDFTIGKQALAWGILDGLQVTDRFDPVDRTEAVFSDPRPRRLARWGLRWQGRAAGLDVDAAAAFDATVSQLPEAGAAFSPTAPRLRAGLGPNTVTPPLRVSPRTNSMSDATLGLRVSREFIGHGASLVIISGPEHDPVFVSTSSPDFSGIELRYPRRSLIGATLDRSDGPRIWRFELAYIPDQPVNVPAGAAAATEDRPRWLAGLGLDWNLPQDVFLNLQLGLDQIDAGPATLVRPETDVIATLRLQRAFRNERLWLKSEILGTLSEGDGTFRPWLEWRQSDHLSISAGADLVWGKQDGLLGQYQNQSRLWSRITATF